MISIIKHLVCVIPVFVMLALALEKPKILTGSGSSVRPERYELIITANDIKDAAEYVVFKYPHKLRKHKNDLKYRLLQHLLASQTSLLVQQVDDDGKVYSYLPTQEIYNDETGDITEPESTRMMSKYTRSAEVSDALPEVESSNVIHNNEKFVPKKAKQTVKFPRHRFVAQKAKKPRPKPKKEESEYPEYDPSVRSPYRRSGQL